MIGKLELNVNGIGHERVVLDGRDITRHIRSVDVHAEAGELPEIRVNLLAGIDSAGIIGDLGLTLDALGSYLLDEITINGFTYKRVESK